LFSGQNLLEMPIHQRPINTVFQSYALFPHMSVFDNVAYGLRTEKRPKTEIRERVAAALTMVALTELADRKPHQLSGGQQQRVAIARAVIKRPRLLLLDEPLSALDYKLRKQMQIELKRLQRELGITFVFVTHDQEEALSMSDRVVVIDRGRVQQVGTPRQVYETPANLFVARFVGESNCFAGQVRSVVDEQSVIAEIMGQSCRLRTGGRPLQPGQSIHVLLRPEDMRLKPPGAVGWPGRIVERNYKGMTLETVIELNAGVWVLANEFFDENDPDFDYGLGEQVTVNWVPDWEWVLPDESA
jgi:spermidine/putrescine transport system ATP-binding protein